MWKISLVYLCVCILSTVFSDRIHYNMDETVSHKQHEILNHQKYEAWRTNQPGLGEIKSDKEQSAFPSAFNEVYELSHYNRPPPPRDEEYYRSPGHDRHTYQSYYDYGENHPPPHHDYDYPTPHRYHRAPHQYDFPPPPHFYEHPPPHHGGPFPPPHHRGPPSPIYHSELPPPPHHRGPSPPPYHRGPPPPPHHRGPPPPPHHRGNPPHRPPPLGSSNDEYEEQLNRPYNDHEDETETISNPNHKIPSKLIYKPQTTESAPDDNSSTYSATTEEEFMLDVRFGSY